MLVYEFYQSARNSLSMRDEDINFPPTIEKLAQLPLRDILVGLSAETLTNPRLAAHFKLMRSLLLLTLNTLNREYLLKEGVEKLQSEDGEASAGSKKKKGKAAKQKKGPADTWMDVD